MSPKREDISRPTSDAMLAAERNFAPANEQLRARVMARVRASVLQSRAVVRVVPTPRRRYKNAVKVVTVPVVLSAAIAFAFQLEHELRERTAPPPRLEERLLPRPRVDARDWLPSSVEIPLEEVPWVPEQVVDPRSDSAGRDSLAGGLNADAYAKELRLLEPAQRAVANKNFAAALTPISEHRQRFPSGVLAEEREALFVKALVGLGRMTEAREAGIRFRKRFPKSTLLGRINALLGIED